MENLLSCACGHSIAQHDADGCQHANCRCVRHTAAVLDEAIDKSRTEWENALSRFDPPAPVAKNDG